MLKASLKRYFLTGLLVVTPIWGTFLILKTLFTAVDGILGDLLAQMVPDHYVPGLGIVALILLVFLTGLFAANFIGKQIVKLWEEWLDRVPLVRGIYRITSYNVCYTKLLRIDWDRGHETIETYQGDSDGSQQQNK